MSLPKWAMKLIGVPDNYGHYDDVDPTLAPSPSRTVRTSPPLVMPADTGIPDPFREPPSAPPTSDGQARPQPDPPVETGASGTGDWSDDEFEDAVRVFKQSPREAPASPKSDAPAPTDSTSRKQDAPFEGVPAMEFCLRYGVDGHYFTGIDEVIQYCLYKATAAGQKPTFNEIMAAVSKDIELDTIRLRAHYAFYNPNDGKFTIGDPMPKELSDALITDLNRRTGDEPPAQTEAASKEKPSESSANDSDQGKNTPTPAPAEDPPAAPPAQEEAPPAPDNDPPEVPTPEPEAPPEVKIAGMSERDLQAWMDMLPVEARAQLVWLASLVDGLSPTPIPAPHGEPPAPAPANLSGTGLPSGFAPIDGPK